MKTARINFLNRSQFLAPVSFAFYDAPENYDHRTLLLPWHQVRNCPPGHAHPFMYTFSLHAQLIDPEEKKTEPFLLKTGGLYRISNNRGYDRLDLLQPAAHGEIVVLNDLPKGSRTILLSRAGSPMALRPVLVPGDYFSFRDVPALIIRRISGAGTTGPLLKNENYIRLAFDGIRAASLVLKGGGAGKTAQPCRFTLEKN